jgi:5-formyltetrahydrofolate cyclo-ligase
VTDLLALRQKLRTQRRTLDSDKQFRFRAAQHIACYLPNDGELDMTSLIDQAWAMGKTVYLPVLSSIHRNHLHFLPYWPDDELVCNRYGIPEPVIRSRRMVDLKRLDLVLLPLVGFDFRGNRLGMGGGFYDFRK